MKKLPAATWFDEHIHTKCPYCQLVIELTELDREDLDKPFDLECPGCFEIMRLVGFLDDERD